MFTSDAARIIGIEPKALRNFLRNRSKGVGSGARYEFSYEEVQRLGEEYWAAQPAKKEKAATVDLPDNPGLPVKWLGDPDHQAEFVAERMARVERLNNRLREVGLTVPQMSEKTLKVGCRALAAALLAPKQEEEVSCEFE